MSILKTDHLTPQQYHVCIKKGTEHPFTGEYLTHKGIGSYHCACCDAPLFQSAHKYDSGSGWPSFFDMTHSDAVALIKDKSLGMIRTEVTCKQCQAHLGHVFEDGPAPTGLRYCVNSAALQFHELSVDAPQNTQKKA